MTNLDNAEKPAAEPLAVEPVDGRVARRQRNIDAVLDVVLEMFAEDAMFPTIEQAATRSGLSLRSLYRYFADPGALLEATIERNDRIVAELSRLHDIGEGPLEQRIDEFVTMRLTLLEGMGPVMRASLANEARHQRVREKLGRDRDLMREQFERQFEPELRVRTPSDRQATTAAGDLLTQLESIDYLLRHRKLSVAETKLSLTSGLHALFSPTPERSKSTGRNS